VINHISAGGKNNEATFPQTKKKLCERNYIGVPNKSCTKIIVEEHFIFYMHIMT
jgi:hypothetical protein